MKCSSKFEGSIPFRRRFAASAVSLAIAVTAAMWAVAQEGSGPSGTFQDFNKTLQWNINGS